MLDFSSTLLKPDKTSKKNSGKSSKRSNSINSKIQSHSNLREEENSIEVEKNINVGVCCMEKKLKSKPM
jgi:hypothetical protein